MTVFQFIFDVCFAIALILVIITTLDYAVGYRKDRAMLHMYMAIITLIACTIGHAYALEMMAQGVFDPRPAWAEGILSFYHITAIFLLFATLSNLLLHKLRPLERWQENYLFNDAVRLPTPHTQQAKLHELETVLHVISKKYYL